MRVRKRYNVNSGRNDRMLEIEFEYKDRYTNGEWNRQSCVMNSIKECKDTYGLGIDCEYRILSVKEV